MYICAYQYKNRKSKENKSQPLNKSNMNGWVKWVIDFLTRGKKREFFRQSNLTFYFKAQIEF